MERISNEKFILAGDIGGTKTRLGIYSKGNRRPELEELKAYSSRNAATKEDFRVGCTVYRFVSF